MSGPFGSSQWMYSSGFYPHEVGQSIRFASESSSYLQRDVSHDRKTFTYAFWFKRTNISRQFIYGNFSNSTNVCSISFDGTPHIKLEDHQSGSDQITIASVNLQRDSEGWAHYVAAVDTTQSTESNRVKIYINGTQQTSLNSSHNTFPSQNHDTKFGDGGTARIGTEGTNERLFLNCYLAEFHIIDGSALGPDSFGETKNGIWVPINTSGLTYGSGGVRLQFQDSSSLGDDTSGNGNDFTSSGLGADHQVIDAPTNNFATLRLSSSPASSGADLSGGNLKYTTGTTGGSNDQDRSFVSTILTPTTNKWYAEYLAVNANFTAQVNAYQGDQGVTGNNTNRIGLINDGTVFETRTTGSATSASYGGSFTSDDVIQVFVDMDNDPPRVAFGKNGSWGDGSGNWNQSNPSSYREMGSDFLTDSTDSPGQVAFTNASVGGGSDASGIANFGQDSTFAGAVSAGTNTDANGQGEFKYAVPSGGLALCTANLPDPGIDPAEGESPTDYFNTVLYTGTGSSASVTGVGFAPDWVWIKERSSTSGHSIHDTVRGTNKRLDSSATSSESASGVTAFGTDGFTQDGGGATGESGQTYVSWNWLAGTAFSNDASSTGVGSIDSAGEVNTEAGFSIIGYTGTGSVGTVAHGLGAVPKMIIYKKRDATQGWPVYHIAYGATKYTTLNSNDPAQSASNNYNNTEPTSTVFSLGDGSTLNGSGNTFIAYCFAEILGYSKFGDYTGNGNADGPVIITGFRPAWVMIKRTDSAEHWKIQDSVRNPSNPVTETLYANLSNSTDTVSSTADTDFLSNGFKLRGAGGQFNADGGTYLYMAFAEQPFKFANAR